jgi:hypothetical protein
MQECRHFSRRGSCLICGFVLWFGMSLGLLTDSECQSHEVESSPQGGSCCNHCAQRKVGFKGTWKSTLNATTVTGWMPGMATPSELLLSQTLVCFPRKRTHSTLRAFCWYVGPQLTYLLCASQGHGKKGFCFFASLSRLAWIRRLFLIIYAIKRLVTAARTSQSPWIGRAEDKKRFFCIFTQFTLQSNCKQRASQGRSTALLSRSNNRIYSQSKPIVCSNAREELDVGHTATSAVAATYELVLSTQ